MKYTEQERQNIMRVVNRANELLEETKRQAVRNCDFETSVGIASRQAQMQAYLKNTGVILL